MIQMIPVSVELHEAPSVLQDKRKIMILGPSSRIRRTGAWTTLASIYSTYFILLRSSEQTSYAVDGGKRQ